VITHIRTFLGGGNQGRSEADPGPGRAGPEMREGRTPG
jgi:hypothetical protein